MQARPTHVYLAKIIYLLIHKIYFGKYAPLTRGIFAKVTCLVNIFNSTFHQLFNFLPVIFHDPVYRLYDFYCLDQNLATLCICI